MTDAERLEKVTQNRDRWRDLADRLTSLCVGFQDVCLSYRRSWRIMTVLFFLSLAGNIFLSHELEWWKRRAFEEQADHARTIDDARLRLAGLK